MTESTLTGNESNLIAHYVVNTQRAMAVCANSFIGWQIDLPKQFRNRLRESTLTGNESGLIAHYAMSPDKRSFFTNLLNFL